MSAMFRIPSVPRFGPATVLELLKPVTWFAPMWAYLCGVVSAGPARADWGLVVLGLVLAGPLVCGMSQAANDWCDRHVDALNEPGRPDPLRTAAGPLGPLDRAGLDGAVTRRWRHARPLGLRRDGPGRACAWAYSAEPFRLKRNGWWSNAVCGLCYEGVPWFTGAAVIAAALPDARIIAVALLYSVGCHGIMTLNDFKSLEGDRAMGLGSLPARLGPERAARLACWTMALPQLAVMALLMGWERPWHAAVVALVLLVQLVLMRRLLTDPRRLAPWYAATGVSLYVAGMMAAALALAGITGGAA